MEIKDLSAFSKIEKACGNRYLAVKIISNAARKLGNQNKDYHISESKLLEWIVTGYCPYTDSELQIRKDSCKDKTVEDILCWVSDKEVCSLVLNFYKQSVKNKKLTECYNKDISQSRVDRANILLRMIWYSKD